MKKYIEKWKTLCMIFIDLKKVNDTDTINIMYKGEVTIIHIVGVISSEFSNYNKIAPKVGLESLIVYFGHGRVDKRISR